MRHTFQNSKTFLLELNLIYLTNNNNLYDIKIDNLRRKHHIGSIPKAELERFVGKEVTDNLVREFIEAKRAYTTECNEIRKREQAQQAQQPELFEEKYISVCYNLPSRYVENIGKISKYEGKRKNKIVMEALDKYFNDWQPLQKTPPTLKSL